MPINILLLNACLSDNILTCIVILIKTQGHKQTMSVVVIIKYAENGSSWMVSCRIYSCEKDYDNTPLFFRIVKDFPAIQIIENFKDDENYRELKK